MDKVRAQGWFGIEIPDLDHSKVEIPNFQLPDFDN